MPYQASVESDLQGGDLGEVYASNTIDHMTHREIDSEIKNSDGHVVGHTVRNAFPDANADYSNKQIGANRLITHLGHNPYETRTRRETMNDMPERGPDELKVQRSLATRNASNAHRNNIQMHQGGNVLGEQIMDSGRQSYNMGGQDRRDYKDRVYVAPIIRKAGLAKPIDVNQSSHVNPVSHQSRLGHITVGNRTETPQMRAVARSAKDATEKNYIGSIRIPDINSKRAQTTLSDHNVKNDVTLEARRQSDYIHEGVVNRHHDVSYLPSVRNMDENPVNGTFDVRNTSHERVDNLPPEYDYANINSRNARESMAPGGMNFTSGDTRPIPNRADYEDNKTTFIKRSELEKANPIGINDKKTVKKTPGGARSYTFEAIVHDRAPGTITNPGEDDSLHSYINGPTNVDNRSLNIHNRFNYNVKQSVAGRRMIVPTATIGKQEKWRKQVYEPTPENNTVRPAPANYTNRMIGPD
uniref:Uncharacterized protein n=1 Tax=viral metagenome TaxID=1070528 RepID=A0A6C0LTU1_9ZZZZ